MKEVLEFIFSDFWHYLGTLVLLAVLVKWRLVKIVNQCDESVVDTISAIIQAAQQKQEAES